MNDNYFHQEYGLTVLEIYSHKIGFNNLANIVSAQEGKFFQRVYQRLSSDDILRILPVKQYLSKSGFPVAIPLKNKKGEYLSEFQGRPSVLFNFLPGKVKYHLSLNELQEVGRTLARFHLCLQNYPNLEDFVTPKKDYNSTKWYDDNISVLERLGTTESKEIIAEYAQLKEQRPKDLDLNLLPLSLLHWDFRDENILFRDGRITGITDFECMCYDNRIYDLIFSVLGFCLPTPELNRAGIKTILDSYASVNPLEEKEIFNLPYLLKLMTWDKWCSFYISETKGLCNKRKSKINHKYYKDCYLKMKTGLVL